jgi:hypothetical protein
MATVMSVRAATRVMLAMAALIGAAVTAMPAPLEPSRPQDDPFVGRIAPWNSLPAGLRVALGEPDTHLVAIVAADIDADGDLDIVASDSALHLYVWMNDAGHLRQKQPARSSSLQPEPAGPTIKHGTAPPPVPTQKDPRSLRAGTEIHPVPLAPMRRATTASPHAGVPAMFAAHTPRAPPAPPAAA